MVAHSPMNILLKKDESQQLIAPSNGSLLAPGDAPTTEDYVSGTLKIYSGLALVGMAVLPFPANVAAGIIGGLGIAIAEGVEAFKKESDEVRRKFAQLRQKIKDLEEVIVKRFDEMKVFLSENKFSMEIIAEVAVLKKLLDDVLDMDDPEALENFRAAYEQNPPLDIAYTVTSLLSQTSTNPLAIGLEKNPKEREETLANWTNILKTVMGDLMVLEAFAAGLLKKKNMYDSDRLIKEYDVIVDIVDDFEERYNIGPWATFKKNFPDFANRLTWIGYDKQSRANRIKEELEKQVTNAAFYILIYDGGKFDEDYYFAAKDYNILQMKNVASRQTPHRTFDVLIYRSYKTKKLQKNDFEKLQKKMDAEEPFDQKKTNKWLVDQEVIKKKGYPADGFNAIFNFVTGLYIDSANCPKDIALPGHQRFMYMGQGSSDWRKTNWIVGLP
ncbi:unnamed protein product [Caenorhabditis brenneri]